MIFCRQMNYAKTFIFFGLVLISLSGKSQEITITPIPYPLDQFLTNIVGMSQDEKGFIWLADNYNGLIRYDGTHKKYYKSNPSNPNSLITNRLETVFAGKDGIIWIGTYSEGLDRFDTNTETFTHFSHDANEPSSLSNNRITSLLEDTAGTLWVGTSKGLDTLDRVKGAFVPIRDQSSAGRLVAEATIRTIYEDKAGAIWVGTGIFFGGNQKSPTDGLYQINKKTSQITRYANDSSDPTSLIDNRIKAIFEDSDRNLWIGSAGDGLHLMDRAKGTFSRLTYDKSNPSGLSRPPVNPDANFAVDHITFINEDSKGFLWIGTYAGGINRYNPKTQRVEFFGKSDDPAHNLGKNDFWTLLKTADGLLWIAGWEPTTENEVLYQLSTFSDKLDYTSINKRVLSFAQDSDGGVWIGSAQGLERYRADTTEASFFSFVQKTLGQKRINDLSFDFSGNLWVATFAGLYQFDRDSRKVTHFEPKNLDPTSLGSNFVLTVLPDLDGKIWIGTAERLDLLDTKTGIFSHYRHIPNDTNSLVSNTVSTLFKDSRGKIWIGTDKGLTLFNPGNGSFQRKLKEYSSIVNNIFEDEKGRIWISTYRSGLFLSDEQGENFRLYKDETGLITNDLLVKGIVGDKERQLWLNTDLGFIKLNPETGVALLFGNSLKRTVENNYNSLRTFLSNQRELFAGDDSGYYHFSLERLQKEYGASPELYWTKFFLGDKEAIPGENKFLPLPISQTKEITLPYNQNSIAFEFGDIDFVTKESEKNILYKLENFDSKWKKVNLDNKIYFNNLPPGDYVLHVKSANRFGNVGEKSISIQILSPWFVKWWAWMVYLLLISAILYWIYSFLLRRKLEHAEVHRLQELDLFKTRLYTNLTHEFRTPLTVISGIADHILTQPSLENLENGLPMIKRNSAQLLRLINQMLDLSKLESGKLSAKMIHDNILSYLKYLTESFHSFADSKDIRLHLLQGFEELDMDFDPEKIQAIFSNLVGNAVKFTPSGGNIYIKIEKIASREMEDFLEIKVRDTGKGIPSEHLPYIFDRFYQVDNSSTRTDEGTGIGLALTKELVLLMSGTIEVNSQLGKGSEFTLRLPVKNEAPKGNAGELIKESRSNTTDLVEASAFGEEEDYDESLPMALLIEDNEDVLSYLELCLQGKYRIQKARNGLQGIQLAIEMIPDIIVSDVMMPEKDGYEVVERLKKDERTSHIPIILLTAKADLDSRLEGLERGADAYLSKPFEKKELEVRLRKLIELRQKMTVRYLAISPEGTPSTPAEIQEDAFLKKLRSIVDANLESEEFGIGELCKELAVSRTQLHRKLKALTNKSTSQVIRAIRMQEAKKLLLNPDLNISEIGYAVGYSNPSHFTQEFTKEFGEAPSFFRKG